MNKIIVLFLFFHLSVSLVQARVTMDDDFGRYTYEELITLYDQNASDTLLAKKLHGPILKKRKRIMTVREWLEDIAGYPMSPIIQRL